MTQLVEFPGLGLSFNINRVALEIGPITIYWYGIIAAAAISIAMIYIYKRANKFGIDGDKMIDITIITMIGGIVGARLYFVAFSWNEEYANDLLKIFRIWEGGIAIYGAIIGGLIVIYFMTKKYKMKLLPVLDLVSAPLILGQAMGRWGNFVNVEAFGSNTTMPWGMTGPTIVGYLEYHKANIEALGVNIDPNMPVHPTFFYESAWCLIGFGVLIWLTNRRKFDGQLALTYFAWYGFGRMIIEGFRTDSLVWGTIRVSQILAGVLTIGAVFALYTLSKKGLPLTTSADLAVAEVTEPIKAEATEEAIELKEVELENKATATEIIDVADDTEAQDKQE